MTNFFVGVHHSCCQPHDMARACGHIASFVRRQHSCTPERIAIERARSPTAYLSLGDEYGVDGILNVPATERLTRSPG